MANVIDRRPQGKSPSAGNRNKFLDRYKKYVKESVDRTIERSKIKDISKKRKIKVPADRMDEPTYSTDPERGIHRRVITGNDRFSRDDRVAKPPEGGSGSKAGNGEDEDSDFEFSLTKEEFLNVLFEDMSLPNYVKENMKSDFKEKRIRAGHTKDGVISQLNIKKSFEQSLARRIAHKGSVQKRIDNAVTEQEKDEIRKRKVPFIEEVDLRYNLYNTIKYPVKTAVMFCLMDVSGSMSQDRKDLAKRFFLLLHLFLEREYERIDIRFIRHTVTAEEVDEETFFYADKSGGTEVSSCYEKMMEIIEEEYDPAIYNIYAAQASDGDNWGYDNDNLLNIIERQVLPAVQYLSYLQVGDERSMDEYHNAMNLIQESDLRTLHALYRPLVKKHEHFNQAQANNKDEVFAALRGLFFDE